MNVSGELWWKTAKSTDLLKLVKSAASDIPLSIKHAQQCKGSENNNYTCLNTNGCIGSPGARGYHDHQGKQGPPAPQGPQGPQGQPGPQGTGATRTIRASRATEVTRVTRDTGATRVTKDTGAARTTKGNQVHQGKNQWIELFENWQYLQTSPHLSSAEEVGLQKSCQQLIVVYFPCVT